MTNVLQNSQSESLYEMSLSVYKAVPADFKALHLNYFWLFRHDSGSHKFQQFTRFSWEYRRSEVIMKHSWRLKNKSLRKQNISRCLNTWNHNHHMHSGVVLENPINKPWTSMSFKYNGNSITQRNPKWNPEVVQLPSETELRKRKTFAFLGQGQMSDLSTIIL